MKKNILTLATAAALILSAAPAYAQDNPVGYVSGAEWIKSADTDDITVEHNTVLRFESNTDIQGNIRLESGAGIEITGGAKVTLISGEIFCEQGSFIEISDGMLKIAGGSKVNNLGTVTMREKGRLKIYSGSFTSRADGVVNNGKFTCLSSGKSLNPVFSSIAKYDKHFGLGSYSLYITGDTASVVVNAYYCIGGKAETNYRYTAAVSEKKTSIKRTSYALERVYSRETENNVLEKITAFEKEYSMPTAYSNGFKRSRTYLYSYKTGDLTYEATWFNYDAEDEIYIEGLDSRTL